MRKNLLRVDVEHVDEFQMKMLRNDIFETDCFSCDKLKIKINNLLVEHMFVCRTAGFIYRDEGLELAKSLFNNVDCFDAFDLRGDYRIGKAFSAAAYWALLCGMSVQRCPMR